jgi:NADH:ubiquinone oxidoreductase subunit E
LDILLQKSINFLLTGGIIMLYNNPQGDLQFMSEIQTPEIDLGPAEKILADMKNPEADALIPILQRIQEAYGYLPKPVLKWVSKKTGIPTSRMHGVITFYSQFHTKPRGRHIIRTCEGTACHVKGSSRITERISEELGIEPGGTTPDLLFTFETVACLGTCFLAPVIMVDEDYFGQLTPDQIPSILKKYN